MKNPRSNGETPYHGFVEDDCLFSQWEIPYDWGIYREYLNIFYFLGCSR